MTDPDPSSLTLATPPCFAVMGETVDTPDGEAVVCQVIEADQIQWTPELLVKVRANTSGRPDAFALFHVKLLANGKETTYPSWQVKRRAHPDGVPPWRARSVRKEPDGPL